MTALVDRLRDVGCDHEPFTPDHAKCICRLAHEAADRIEVLEMSNKLHLRALETVRNNSEQMLAEIATLRELTKS